MGSSIMQLSIRKRGNKIADVLNLVFIEYTQESCCIPNTAVRRGNPLLTCRIQLYRHEFHPSFCVLQSSVLNRQLARPVANHSNLFHTGTRVLAAQVQKPAPDFAGTAVVDAGFKDIRLADFKGKYLVLFFYPLDFTFVCPTEIVGFSDRIEEFKSLNAEVSVSRLIRTSATWPGLISPGRKVDWA